MNAKELRKKYIDFFVNKGHTEIKSAPLVPENDPTVLFTTAGMHPLVPYLLGEKHPSGNKLVNFQKCIRTGDIDEVGDPVHLTFFEMLGNWSLGQYFKEDAIAYSFEFLTSSEYLNIPLNKLAVTVFAGNDDAPFDEDAYNIWSNLGISKERIAKLGEKDNWWGPAGETGPCGPDTEMFYWTGQDEVPVTFDPENKLWVEIWNDVFMQYNKTESGTYEPLKQCNVDTGMGLERVNAILQGKASCYETELFTPLFNKLDEIRGQDFAEYANRVDSERIVVEHIRAASFIMLDDITPGNVDQSYVLRRLIRRAIREGRKLGIEKSFVAELAKVVIDEYSSAYPEFTTKKDVIIESFNTEENQFAKTLVKGTKEFEKLINNVPDFVKKKVISGKKAFFLYETYGFPVELTEEMAKEKGFELDKQGFDKAFKKHQELSRKGAEQKFKGGLADNSEATSALHTATHILHQALKQVLGDHVEQKGSNITSERLRFDFSHPEKMTPEQKNEINEIVNGVIQKNAKVICEEMSVGEAKNQGAIGLFEGKYAEKVKVYSIGEFSKEICGGPHVSETKKLGKFRIKKEESSSRGVRRIKAILEV